MYLKLILLIFLQTIYGSNVDDKIIGGQLVDITLVPYYVSIQYQGGHFCGGSILNELWILSAAHCRVFTRESYKIRSGSSNVTSGGRLDEIEVDFVHPRFNYIQTNNNDFWLIKLKNPMTFDATRQPIELGNSSMYAGGTEVYVAGHGFTNKTDEDTEFLRGITVELIDQGNCTKVHNTLTSSMVCTTSPKRSPCYGDFGSGLKGIKSGALLGVVSFVYDCGNPDYPVVYAKVSEAKDWIELVISTNCRKQTEILTISSGGVLEAVTVCNFYL